jgi:hypothetical protein
MGHVVALTMVKDESFWLPRWLDYYGAELGADRLYVIDHGSEDGSTSGIDASVIRLPRDGRSEAGSQQAEASKPRFDRTRADLVNGLAAGLLGYADTVVYVDVDEFLVPHPRTGLRLGQYLEGVERDAVAAVGLNLIHVPAVEPDFDPGQPLLAQRRHVVFVPRMCKPSVKRVRASWTAGFHGLACPYEVDPDLLLIHGKFFDTKRYLTAHEQRARLWEEGFGGQRSTWRMPLGRMRRQLTEWQDVDPSTIHELKIEDLDLDVVQDGVKGQRDHVSGAGLGGQAGAMRERPVLRLPDSFTAVF